jgi:hypothetical protein
MHSWISHIHWVHLLLPSNRQSEVCSSRITKPSNLLSHIERLVFALKGLLTSSPLPSVACMYQSVLLELHIFGFCYFRFCCCVPPSAHASLAWLVISGCIRIEGSVASSLIGFFGRLHVSVDTARFYTFWTRCFRLRCGVFTCAHHSHSLQSQAAFTLRAQ